MNAARFEFTVLPGRSKLRAHVRHEPVYLSDRVIDTRSRLSLSLEIRELASWSRVTAYRLLLRDLRGIRASDEQERPECERGCVAEIHAVNKSPSGGG